MIFSELYSAYYNTVAAIISKIIDGENSEKELQKVVSKYAFSESLLTIMPSLKNGKWQLVTSDMTTKLEHKPTMPLTKLQKQWLKAISLDPRVKLFDVKFEGLDDVEPLFTKEDYCVFDKYADGDPYEDASYIEWFRIILDAVRNKIPLLIEMKDRKGKKMRMSVMPDYLEYSEKDDKFRLFVSGCRYVNTVNLGRITKCEKISAENNEYKNFYDAKFTAQPHKNAPSRILTLEVTDNRNALERVLMHFAHFEKQAEKIDEKHYIVKIKYRLDDETEMVIRVLSFGPNVKVLAPNHFINLIKERLKKQRSCGLK